ncbi:exodeoxyribonuclease VII small subunit [Marinobacter hydrocarbonoclasticus]|nr:exodeoxyribonuclease VII small subunit [Marinobacter nauticus]
MAKKPENMAFEAALAELEQIVAQLEQGEVPLEQALAQFERGIALVRASQQKLEQAQQQVRILSEDPTQPLQPFGAEDA